MVIILTMLFLAALSLAASKKDNDIAQQVSVIRGQNAILPCGREVDVLYPGETANWYKNDASFENKSAGEESALRLSHVSSQDAGSYRCRVFSDDGPSREKIYELNIIDVHGPPKIMFANNASLFIESSIGPFREGSEISLHCVVEDSHPSTKLRWFRNDEAMVRARRTSNSLCAELIIRNMSRNEHRVKYECRAESQNITKSAGFLVQMTLPPLNVSIMTDNNDAFEAGTPRVLACIVYGCVPSPNVTWYLGDTMLKPNVYKEVNRGNFTVSSLTFVPSLSDNGKELVCQVTNDFIAQTFEDRVTVSVGHRPMCLDSGYKSIGAIEGESETLVCVVESNPPPGQFTWTFADSRTLYTSSKKVPGYEDRYSTTLNWVPQADDFGPLYCRATNQFGEQKEPCTYSVINGGPPTTPQCDMFWEDLETLKVRCDKNWDGGRPQTMHVEVKSMGKVIEVSKNGQEVQVDHLQPGANVTAVVYTTNSRGESPSVYLTLPANLTLQTETPHFQVFDTDNTWLKYGAVTVAALIAFSLLALISFYALFTWKSRHPSPHVIYHSKEDDGYDIEAVSCTNPSKPSKYVSFKCSVTQFEEDLEECRYVGEPFVKGSTCTAPESTHGLGDRYEFCV